MKVEFLLYIGNGIVVEGGVVFDVDGRIYVGYDWWRVASSKGSADHRTGRVGFVVSCHHQCQLS